MAAIDNPQDRYNYIRQGALSRGIDPALVDRLVRSEGGYKTFDLTGDSGRSFGPFQDYTGGGLGNQMRAQGLEPSNPALETQNIDWNLNYIAEHGASPDVWHGLRRGSSTGERALEGTLLSKGVKPGERYEGATYLGDVMPTEDNGLSAGGALLLSGLLKASHPEEANEDTGNPLLNSIISQAMPNDNVPAAQHPPEEFIEPPVAQPPRNVPELQPGPVPTPAAPQPLPTGPAPPMPGQPSTPAPSAPTGPVMPAATPAAPQPVSPTPAPAPAAGGSFNPLNLLMGTAHAAEAARPATQPPGAPAVPTTGTGSRLLDGLLHNIIAGSRGAGPVLGPAIRALTPPPTTVPSEEEHAQAPPLERMLTGGGIVPPATTDIQQAQAEQRAQQAGPLSVPERLTQLGQAVTPYIAGGAPGGAMSSGIRLPGRGALPAAERIEPTLGRPAGGGGPPAEPPNVGEAAAQPPAKLPPPKGVTYQALDDDLFKAQQTSEAEKIEALKIGETLKANGITVEDLQQAYHIRESRMTKRPLPETNQSKLIESVLAPLDDRVLRDAQWIYEHAPDVYKTMPEAPLRSAQEGHVHRKVVGYTRPGERLDPSEGDILTRTFLRGGSLSKKASGLMRRDPDFVWENNEGGTSKIGRLGANKQSAQKYGETFTDKNGVKWTARAPTTKELEAHYPGRKYVDDLVANTIDNALRIGRVRRNIEILEKWKPRLYDEGLWVPENTQGNIPSNLTGRIDVPQLRGHADPMVAAIVNDVFRSAGNDWAKAGDAINKVLIGSMFWLPIRHQLNVAAHYAVGRGFDWLYRNPNLLRAATQVATLGPEYIRHLKAGAGLRYASTQTENFYNTLLTKLGHDIPKDPEWQGIAKALGFNHAQHLAETVYKASRSSLWKVNDIFLTARIMELERAGKPLPEAIKIAENEIPNYRLPTNNLALRHLLNSPLIAFGRYGYGRANALVKTVQNLVGPKATGEERLRALGQALILTLVGTAGYTIANHALQETQKQLMGVLGEKRGKRILGDKPLEFAETGPYGVVREAARYGLSYMPKSVQNAQVPIINQKIGALVGLEPEAEDWSKLLGSLITASPALDLTATILGGGRNPFTGQQVVNPHGHLPAEAVQGAEYLGGLLNPLGTALTVMRKGLIPGIGPQLGFKQEYKPPGKIMKMERRRATKQEQKDPLQRGANELFR